MCDNAHGRGEHIYAEIRTDSKAFETGQPMRHVREHRYWVKTHWGSSILSRVGVTATTTWTYYTMHQYSIKHYGEDSRSARW